MRGATIYPQARSTCISVLCEEPLHIRPTWGATSNCSMRGATGNMFYVRRNWFLFLWGAPAYRYLWWGGGGNVICSMWGAPAVLRGATGIFSYEDHLHSGICSMWGAPAVLHIYSPVCREHVFFYTVPYVRSTYICVLCMWGAPAYLFCIRRTGLEDLRQRLQTRVATTPPNILSEIYLDNSKNTVYHINSDADL